MGYVESSLIDGEVVVVSGRVHGLIFLPGYISCTSSILLFLPLASQRFFGSAPFGAPKSVLVAMAVTGALFAMIGLLQVLKAFVRVTATELAVTDRRVIAKFGFIRRNTIELLHRNVESFHVEQGFWGRIFNFGTLVINGTGGIRTPIPRIAAPLEFRKQALVAIENGQRREQ